MILITGATGFVGQNLSNRLAGTGIKARCLLRDPDRLDAVQGLQTVQGDLLDRGSLNRATQDITTVIHLAAVIKSSNPKDLVDTNADGTRNLVEACVKNGVKKIIYLSSLDVDLDSSGLYAKTKLMGEDAVRGSGIEHTILRPSFIYGRGSANITLLAGLIRKYPVTPVVGSGQGKLQPVYIDDVCDTLIRLIGESGKNKTYYIAGEEEISLNDLIDKIAAIYGKRVFKLHIPLWLLWLPLKLLSLISSGKSLDYESLRLLNTDKACDIFDIKNDLGFTPLSLDEGLRRTLLARHSLSI